MLKRPLFPLPSTSPTCFDYHAWTRRHYLYAVEEHENCQVYDYRREDLPDEPYYNVDLASYDKNVFQICDGLEHAASTTTITDEGLSDLRSTLTQATSIPRPNPIVVAVVGNQGMGKSSTINALLNRNLVEVLGGSEACTAFATIIEYKEGADDDTDESDVKVTFLSQDEICDFIEEHIRRYAEFATRSSLHEDNESDADESDDSAQASTREESRTISKAVQQGADTAEVFFRIMFDANFDESADFELQGWLREPDLEDGRFQQRLMQMVAAHLSFVQGKEGGVRAYTEIPDKSLEQVRNWSKMWPLVKSVTISTGSVLLRNGLCLIDLPGYGDLNQTRSAVVNQFRRIADFEIIVATSDRYLTKIDEDRYLTRAIRQQGAANVFLVLNKIDYCLHMPDDEVRQKLKKRDYEREPFLSIERNLEATTRISSGDVARYRQYLVNGAQRAFCQHECDKIAQKMQKKGIKVFPVSASQYRQWLDPGRLQEPSYKPEETGIPQLRKALLAQAAVPNYENLCTHTFETFSDIGDKVARILEKFRDDDTVNGIRHHLRSLLPSFGLRLKGLASTVPQQLVSEAWDYTEQLSIAVKMDTMVTSYANNTHYQTFSLMLRNNGFANGSQKYAHRNLNKDFLEVYKPQLKVWKNNTILKAKTLCRTLNDVVQVPLKDVQKILDVTPGNPTLKTRADEELKKLHRRIELAQDRLLSRLEGAVHETYRHFTTEDDIKCPIALYFKEAYTRIHNIRGDEGRRPGIYRQQRTELLCLIRTSADGKPPLLAAIPRQVKTRQCDKWRAISEDFVADVLARFEAFTHIMQDLLVNEVYASNEHKMVRERLARQLPEFRRLLGVVHGMFPGVEARRGAKKARCAGAGASGSGVLDGVGAALMKLEAGYLG